MELYECPRCGPVRPGQILYDGHRCALCTTPLRVAASQDWRNRRIAQLEAEVVSLANEKTSLQTELGRARNEIAEQGRQLSTMRSA